MVEKQRYQAGILTKTEYNSPQKKSLNIHAGLGKQDASVIFAQDYSFMNEMKNVDYKKRQQQLDYLQPTIITTARETKTTNFFFDKRLQKQVSTGNLIQNDYIQGVNPARQKKFTNYKLHCILGVKTAEKEGRFNESNSQKSLKDIESKKAGVKKKKKQHAIESLVVSDPTNIDTATIRQMQNINNTPIKRNLQSSTGLNLDLPQQKWNSSMPEEGLLAIDKVKKSGQIVSGSTGGIIKNKESLKSFRIYDGAVSSTSQLKNNAPRQASPKKSKYQRQVPFLSLSSLNARKKSLENQDQQTKNQYHQEQPNMGIAGQKMQLQNYLPDNMMQIEDEQVSKAKFYNIQAQQGVQKDTTSVSKGLGMTPEHNQHIRIYLKNIQHKAAEQGPQPKQYFIMPQTLYHKTPQLNVNSIQLKHQYPHQVSNFEKVIKEAAINGQPTDLIIDSNVDHSKSLERFVDVLEKARVKEQQETSKYMKSIVKPTLINHQSRTNFNHIRSTSSINNNTEYLNNDSDLDQIDDLSHITPRKQKFIVKISTPMPPQPKKITMPAPPNLNLGQPYFQAFEPIQNNPPWPLQYSDYNKYFMKQGKGIAKILGNLIQTEDQSKRINTRQQHQAQSYQPWIDHTNTEEFWLENTYDQQQYNNNQQ